MAAWLGRCILPWEAEVRGRLRRLAASRDEIDDIIQESYTVIAGLEDVSHIVNPRSYFLTVAKNIRFAQLRRSRVVRIDTVTEIDSLSIPDERPSQEFTAIARQDLAQLRRLIDGLPARCRAMFVLRKIEGLPQKEIAKKLGVTENTVETQVRRGLSLILKAWADGAQAQVTVQDVEGQFGRQRKPD